MVDWKNYIKPNYSKICGVNYIDKFGNTIEKRLNLNHTFFKYITYNELKGFVQGLNCDVSFYMM